MLKIPRYRSSLQFGIVRVQIACGAPDSFFLGHGKVAPRSAGPRRCRVGEGSQQVKAREVSCMNVVIGLKWV